MTNEGRKKRALLMSRALVGMLAALLAVYLPFLNPSSPGVHRPINLTSLD